MGRKESNQQTKTPYQSDNKKTYHFNFLNI